MARICLITPGHPSKNPRLVKEADALAEAGDDVHVIAGDYHPWGHDADRQYQDRPWELERVSYGAVASSGRQIYLGGRKRIAETLAGWLPQGTRAVNLRAQHWAIPELVDRAQSVPAELFIAHYLPAVPAALHAAEKHGAKAAFDAEDFHRGQFHDDERGSPEAERTRWFEETYLPQCESLTAASPGIARAYADELDIEEPTTILNVFPRSERSGHTPPQELREEHPGDGISLYWYSQTIGPDRGLEMVVRAMGQIQDRVDDAPCLTLSLRGSWTDGYKTNLHALARSVGIENKQIRHLTRTPPDQLIERAAQHDIGLALEQAKSRNRDLCVTNKIFAYLLAGLPVVATNTQGQQFVHRHAPNAVRLCAIDDVGDMAQQLCRWVRDAESRKRASEAAYQAAEDRYNWDVEKETLLSTVRTLLA
ncbi:glycosyltransferase family protein [Salinibacter grassmerensis]|uniref:glycosyltransferase family protein n=1 Tax=Salinibacter grassmerensis TaxID=3040353 RepID=UPI0021E7C25F|nr:glycosyltransferase [Salinibacter grassmerensis]